MVYIRFLCRDVIKYTVIFGVYIRLWPTLMICSAVGCGTLAGALALYSTDINFAKKLELFSLYSSSN